MSEQASAEAAVIEQGFDYSGLGTALAQTVRAATERIKAKVKRTIRDVITVGVDLLDVKAALPHGAFLPWLAAEFAWTEKTAQRFMAVAAWLSDQSDIVSEMALAPTAAYRLAVRSTPESAREEALRRAQTGERITPRVAREILERERDREAARRKERRVPASGLRPRLARVLERYGERCQNDTVSELAEQLREFAAALERSKTDVQEDQQQ